MLRARLRLSPALATLVAQLPALRRKIRGALHALLADASIGKRLQDPLAGLWSLPVGRWRIIYRPGRDLLEIVAIGPRKTIYQEAERLGRRAGGPSTSRASPLAREAAPGDPEGRRQIRVGQLRATSWLRVREGSSGLWTNIRTYTTTASLSPGTSTSPESVRVPAPGLTLWVWKAWQ